MDDDDLNDDMINGDGEEETEEEVNKRLEERAQVLGFKPQKEIIYNSLLPYCDKLDAESGAMWTEIKANFGKSIILRELRPGFITWSTRLSKYLKLYGFKFSKEDHVQLIKTLYAVLTMPDLDPWMTNRAASSLIGLLKRKELLTPEDLTLPWRPLYELYERFMYSPFEAMGMVQYPQ